MSDLWKLYRAISDDNNKKLKIIQDFLIGYYHDLGLDTYPDNLFIHKLADTIAHQFLPMSGIRDCLDMTDEALIKAVQTLDLKACYLKQKLEFLFSDISVALHTGPTTGKKKIFYDSLMRLIQDTCNESKPERRFDVYGPELSFVGIALPHRDKLLKCFQGVHDEFYKPENQVSLKDNKGSSLLFKIFITPLVLIAHFFTKFPYQSLRKNLEFIYLSRYDQAVERIKLEFEENDCYQKIQKVMPLIEHHSVGAVELPQAAPTLQFAFNGNNLTENPLIGLTTHQKLKPV